MSDPPEDYVMTLYYWSSICGCGFRRCSDDGPDAQAEFTNHECGPLPGWWLSFCDASLPEGTQFLGACLVRAPIELFATIKAHELGINPGGEVAIMGPLLPDSAAKIPDEWWNRLLSREECAEFDRIMEQIAPHL